MFSRSNAYLIVWRVFCSFVAMLLFNISISNIFNTAFSIQVFYSFWLLWWIHQLKDKCFVVCSYLMLFLEGFFLSLFLRSFADILLRFSSFPTSIFLIHKSPLSCYSFNILHHYSFNHLYFLNQKRISPSVETFLKDFLILCTHGKQMLNKYYDSDDERT